MQIIFLGYCVEVDLVVRGRHICMTSDTYYGVERLILYIFITIQYLKIIFKMSL